MAKIKKPGSVKRFGARYGRKLKDKLGNIEKEQKKKKACPYCSKLKVKRCFAGVWQCTKCNSKFTARAYSIEGAIKEKVSDQGEQNEL